MTSNKAKGKSSKWKSRHTNPSRLSQEYSTPVLIKTRPANPTAEEKPKKQVSRYRKQAPSERSRYRDCLVEYLRQHGKADKKKLTINQIRDRILHLHPEFRKLLPQRFLQVAGKIVYQKMMEQKMQDTHVVYFVSYEDQPNFVKIGYTKSILTRVSTLETSSWQDLLIRHLVYFASQATENAMHERFAEQRIRPDREWFKVEGKLKSFLQNKPTIKVEDLVKDPFIYQKFDERQPVPEGEGPIIST